MPAENKLRNDFENELYDLVVVALKKKDEKLLKHAVLSLMNGFVDGKVRQYNVDYIASAYLNAEVFWEECKDFEIKDEVLRTVYEKLAAIDQHDADEARKIVKGFIKLLS